MNPISFFAPGIPKGQPRPRAFARKFGAKWQARVYDAGTAEGWKSDIAVAIKPHLPPSPITGPVRLLIALQMPRIKAHFKKDKVRDNAPYYHVGKPDLDNHAKAVMDALTAVGVWVDDAQVCELTVTKTYGLRTGAAITITELQQPNLGPVSGCATAITSSQPTLV